MSTLGVTTIKSKTSGSAVSFTDSGDVVVGQLCKAWVHYNGATNAILDSFNVDSVTDRGTGKFTVNFTVAMASANYAVNLSYAKTGTSEDANMDGATGNADKLQTGSLVYISIGYGSSTTLVDSQSISVAVFAN